MNRQEFMKQLEQLLSDLPENDRQDAISYYNDYFDDAGAENEATVIQKLGSPGRVAATIKADLQENSAQQGEYTERGYRDGSTPDVSNPLAKREAGSSASRRKNKFPAALIVVLIVFASPLILGAGGGLIGLLMGLLATVFCVIIAIAAIGTGCLIGGIAGIVASVGRLFFSPISGLACMGLSLLALAIGLLFIALLVRLIFVWLPAWFRRFVNFCGRLLNRSKKEA